MAYPDRHWGGDARRLDHRCLHLADGAPAAIEKLLDAYCHFCRSPRWPRAGGASFCVSGLADVPFTFCIVLMAKPARGFLHAAVSEAAPFLAAGVLAIVLMDARGGCFLIFAHFPSIVRIASSICCSVSLLHSRRLISARARHSMANSTSLSLQPAPIARRAMLWNSASKATWQSVIRSGWFSECRGGTITPAPQADRRSSAGRRAGGVEASSLRPTAP